MDQQHFMQTIDNRYLIFCFVVPRRLIVQISNVPWKVSREEVWNLFFQYLKDCTLRGKTLTFQRPDFVGTKKLRNGKFYVSEFVLWCHKNPCTCYYYLVKCNNAIIELKQTKQRATASWNMLFKPFHLILNTPYLKNYEFLVQNFISSRD